MNRVAREEMNPTTEERSFSPGTILNEVFDGWRYPAVTDKVSRGRSWEFAKNWRLAQAKTERPVKFGTVCGRALGSCLEIKTPAYAEDKRELVAAGCEAIQIEDPTPARSGFIPA